MGTCIIRLFFGEGRFCVDDNTTMAEIVFISLVCNCFFNSDIYKVLFNSEFNTMKVVFILIATIAVFSCTTSKGKQSLIYSGKWNALKGSGDSLRKDSVQRIVKETVEKNINPKIY